MDWPKIWLMANTGWLGHWLTKWHYAGLAPMEYALITATASWVAFEIVMCIWPDTKHKDTQ